MMYGQMTAGSWIYIGIGSPGHVRPSRRRDASTSVRMTSRVASWSRADSVVWNARPLAATITTARFSALTSTRAGPASSRASLLDEIADSIDDGIDRALGTGGG